MLKCYSLIEKKNNTPTALQWARKFKKFQAKKLVKSNKSISRIGQIPFFAISKMAKNQFLNWEKVLSKMQFHEILLDVHGKCSN